jgi:DMSO/TMAO reductase YedYZ heme-binding membrane subunit
MSPERTSFVKRVLLVNALVPLVLLGGDAARGELGANPVELVLRATGILALVFLALTLTVTPARQLLGAPWLGKLRRLLGLVSFGYACLHVTIYVVLDQGLDVAAIATDLVTRPFVTFGALAFGLMVPLAWTSTDAAIRRLGRRWAALHRRIYVVAVCAVVHFWLVVKADTTRPILFAVVFGVLLFYRYVRAGVPKPGGR